MTGKHSIAAALSGLEQSGFVMGDAWHRAHEIAQAREGDRLYDRLHALLHRIEGDEWNAGYWYRRAGVAPFEANFADEAEQLRQEVR
jgi:hypothetical protein